MNIQDFLHSIPLSKGLLEEQLQILAQASKVKIFSKGELIIGEENKTNTFYIVAQGIVKMFKNSSEGKEQTLYLFEPGEMFGMCAAFSDSVFPANVVALQDSKILIIPGNVLTEIAKKDQTILFNLIFILSRMLKESMALVESLSLKEIPQRVAAFLLLSTSKDQRRGENIIKLPVSHRELSKILGTTPETLSRVLKRMTASGIIVVEGRYISTIDRKALTRLAED